MDRISAPRTKAAWFMAPLWLSGTQTRRIRTPQPAPPWLTSSAAPWQGTSRRIAAIWGAARHRWHSNGEGRRRRGTDDLLLLLVDGVVSRRGFSSSWHVPPHALRPIMAAWLCPLPYSAAPAGPLVKRIRRQIAAVTGTGYAYCMRGRMGARRWTLNGYSNVKPLRHIGTVP